MNGNKGQHRLRLYRGYHKGREAVAVAHNIFELQAWLGLTEGQRDLWREDNNKDLYWRAKKVIGSPVYLDDVREVNFFGGFANVRD
jgi:hypothetical protein